MATLIDDKAGSTIQTTAELGQTTVDLPQITVDVVRQTTVDIRQTTAEVGQVTAEKNDEVGTLQGNQREDERSGDVCFIA